MTDNLDVTTGQTQQEPVETAEAGTVTEEMKDTPIEEKPKQTREQNSEYARKRRKEEFDAALEKARMEAVFDMYDHINPFTNDEMKDMEDYKELLDMKQLKREGKDPLTGRSDLLKKRAREAEEKKKAEEKDKQELENMLDEFKTNYPDVKAEELLADEDFRDYADGKLGRKSLSEVYKSYNERNAKLEEKANRKAAQSLANAQASPGSATRGQVEEEGFFSIDDVRNMSEEDIRKNFDAIDKSRKKW